MIKINLLDASSEKKDQLDGKATLPLFEQIKDMWADISEKYNLGSGGGDDETSINPLSLILKMVIIFSGVILMYAHEINNIPILQKVLRDEEAKIKSLDEFNSKDASAVAEIKKIKKNKADIERQIESIDILSKRRLRYVKAIDIIQQNIQDKMWLTTLKSEGDLLSLEGVAYTDVEISNFIEILSKNIQFSEVQLLTATESSLADPTGKKFRNFNISCTMEKIR